MNSYQLPRESRVRIIVLKQKVLQIFLANQTCCAAGFWISGKHFALPGLNSSVIIIMRIIKRLSSPP